MGMSTSLVALALLGGEPTSVPAKLAQEIAPTPVVAEPCPEITCEVEVLTVEGLGWRSAAYASLKPAARQGTATIWTADRSLVATLEAAAATRASGRAMAIKAPKIVTAPGAVATVTSDKMQDYIQHVRRVADGPINGGTAVAYIPEVASVREGFSAVFSGRKLDQGVIAQVKFAESHVGSMHTITLPERVTPPPVAPIASLAPSEVGRHIVQTVLAPKAATLNTTIQLPEVFLSEVEGEWFVPNDGVLLISTGVNTVADEDGKAVVQERLAILDFARPAAEADAAVAQAGMFPACRVDATTAVALENYANLSMPRVPDRSFPEAVDASGKVFDLPPLPESYAANDLNQISPGSPLATPQGTPITRPARSIGDPQMVQASFEPIPDSEIQGWSPRPTSFATEPAAPAGLAAMVESFLRSGMEAAARVPVPAGFQPTPIGVNLARPGDFPAPGTVMDFNIVSGPNRPEPFPTDLIADDLDFNIASGPKPGLAGLIESCIDAISEAVNPSTKPACATTDCPAEGCPYSAQGCDRPGTARQVISPAKVSVDVNFSDPTGVKASSGPLNIDAAFKNPGKAEVNLFPLGGGVSLQIEAKIVPTPAVAAQPGAGSIQR